MQSYIVTIALVVFATIINWSIHKYYGGSSSGHTDNSENLSVAFPHRNSTNLGEIQGNRIKEVEAYIDPQYGFSLAVPVGWTKIVADDSDTNEPASLSDALDIGYAIGFESPRENGADVFADYILIEVLPGNDSGLFEATENSQRFFDIMGESVGYDKLNIDSSSDDNVEVDLVIFQRGVQALGYTLSFYAIGEPSNEQTLSKAFEIMLRTYEQTADPFVIL